MSAKREQCSEFDTGRSKRFAKQWMNRRDRRRAKKNPQLQSEYRRYLSWTDP